MPRAVVVGAGIGGLASAIALRRIGWDVDVLERAPEVREVGAGISLWSNALTALGELGVADAIRALGTTEASGGVRSARGRWLMRANGPEVLARQGLSLLLVHRAVLLAELRAAAPRVRTGVTVEHVDPDGTVVSSAGADRADLVVAADGVHSAIRATLGLPQATYAGFTAWRGVTDSALDLPELSETWGRGREVGITRLLDGRGYWFATANQPAGMRFADERAEVCARFRGWPAPIGDVLAATSTVLRHDVFALPTPLQPFQAGRIAFVGDAAHAMTPNLGQGGAQALEDAVTLAVCVREGRELSWYDAQRRPRAERLARTSAELARLVQTESRALARIRDVGVRLTPRDVPLRRLAHLFSWTPPH